MKPVFKKRTKGKIIKFKREINALCNIADIYISLNRGPTQMGERPSYKLKVKGTGEVVYEEGSTLKKSTISQSDVLVLLNKAVDIGFFSLRPSYQGSQGYSVQPNGEVYLTEPMGVTCMTTNIVTVVAGELKHNVVDYDGAPTRLYEFESLIDEVCNVAQWQRVTKEKINKIDYEPSCFSTSADNKKEAD